MHDIVLVLQIFLRLTKKYSAEAILAHDYLADVDQAIKDIGEIARRLAPVRAASCNAAIAKLEKYLMKALDNDWLCVAFSESCKVQYSIRVWDMC